MQQEDTDVRPNRSPTAFDAEIDIPVGIFIETFRYGRRWICSVNGRTLSSVGGIVLGSDPVFVVAVKDGLKEDATRIYNWLKTTGHGVVAMEDRDTAPRPPYSQVLND